MKSNCLILILGISILLSMPVQASHIVNNGTYYGEFFREETKLTGMLCSTSPSVTIHVNGGGVKRSFATMYKQSGQQFKNQNKLFAKNCNGKNYLHYFSGRLHPQQAASPTTLYRVDNGATFSPKNLSVNKKQVGILYHTWHCPYSTAAGKPIHDQAKIASDIINSNNTSSIGPLRWPHWKAKPYDDYYCLSNNSNLIKKHAAQLINAGVDYIYIDLTNAPRAYDSNGAMSSEFESKYHRPIMTLLNQYKSYYSQNLWEVPKIVLWLGTTTEYKTGYLPPNMRVARWVREQYLPAAGPLHYYRPGVSKPLLLYKVSKGKYQFNQYVSPSLHQTYAGVSLASYFNTKPQWSEIDHIPQTYLGSLNRNSVWSFMEPCQTVSGQVATNCQQRVNNGNQLSISAYYQRSYALSNNAIARRNGRTFYQQFQQAFNNSIDYISISGWNAWLSKRVCNGSATFGFIAAKSALAPYGEPPYNDYNWHDSQSLYNGCNYSGTKWYMNFANRQFPTFIDMYSYDRSRDMEPDRKHSDCYFQLMREMVLRAKAGENALPGEVKSRFSGTCGFQLAN